MSHSRMIYDQFQARSAKIFMGFYDSLMDIFDPKKSFMTRIIFVSFMDIYDQKNREAQKTFQGHFLSH